MIFRRRTRIQQFTINNELRHVTTGKEPVYIYPGLIRLSTPRAMQIDKVCRPAIYQSHAGQQDMTNNCSICLDSFRCGREIIRILPCSHIFHSRCILSWVAISDRCPLCNTSIFLPSHITQMKIESQAEITKKNDDNSGCPLAQQSRNGCGDAGTSCNKDEKEKRKLCDHDSSKSKSVQSREYSFVLHDKTRFSVMLTSIL